MKKSKRYMWCVFFWGGGLLLRDIRGKLKWDVNIG